MPSPESIQFIALIAMFVLLGLSIVDPFYGLLSYLIAMLTRIGLYYPILATVRIELLIGLILLMEILILKKNTHRLGLKANPVNKYMFLFFVVILLSFLQAWDYEVSFTNGVMEFIKVYIFFLMIVCLVDSEAQVTKFLWAFAFLTVFVGYEGLYSYFSGQSSYVFQGVEVSIASRGFAAGHVAAANMQLQCLPIMIYLTIASRKPAAKILGVVLVGLSIVAVVASGSRGGFAGLLLTAALTIYFSKRRLVAGLICVIVAILLLPVLGGAYLSWMKTLVGGADDSAISRTTGLINGFEMMVRRPILGVGPECYPLARKAWFGWGLEAHNHYGQLLGDLGIAGAITWGPFLYYLFKNLIYAKRTVREALSQHRGMVLIITGIQVSLLVRLFEGWGSHSLYLFYWYMIAALSVVMLEITQRKNVEDPTYVPNGVVT